MKAIRVGSCEIVPAWDGEMLRSLGSVGHGDVILRNPAVTWLPWFDGFDGGVFDTFRFVRLDDTADTATLHLDAVASMRYPFRERRDASGDLCFTQFGPDAEPYQASVRVVFAPEQRTIDGMLFDGFRYHYEVDSPQAPVHRLIDRQSWEVGGNLDDVSLALRNWIAKPYQRVRRDDYYSTVGLGEVIGPMPGNLWGRWTQLPGFELQHGRDGIVVARYDHVSNIRCAIESCSGEDALRVQDLHLVEQDTSVATNRRIVLFSSEAIDGVDARNLWTRITDQEFEMSSAQFGVREDKPRVVNAENVWVGYRFDTTYEESVAKAADLGCEMYFIDVIWEQMQALREELASLKPEDDREGMALAKLRHESMCVMFDWEVARIFGGEAGLKALCDRSCAKGIDILSWLGLSMGFYSDLGERRKWEFGANAPFAMKESGVHPDAGYAITQATLDLNGPVKEYMSEKILGVCERTGLKGFLMDSYSNMGWWQVDYRRGTMKPQYAHCADVYARLTQAGLYLMPEALVAFSRHSMLHQYTGDMYEGELLGYSYDTNMALPLSSSGDPNGPHHECGILTGSRPIDLLFRCVAHRRLPLTSFHHVPRAEWNEEAAATIRNLFMTYGMCQGSCRIVL